MARSVFTITDSKGSKVVTNQKLMDSVSTNLRVALPGIVTAFDSRTQTVSVQPAITENVRDNDNVVTDTKLPILLDVPLVMPRSGGYSLTMPVSIGDECLVIFADSCINCWWTSGGVQKQEEIRRHDLSDAFAILGTWSQPSKPATFSTNSAKLVNESTGVGVEVTNEQVKLTGMVMIGSESLASYIQSFIPV